MHLSVVVQPAQAPQPNARVTFNETNNRRHTIGNDNRNANLRPVR